MEKRADISSGEGGTLRALAVCGASFLVGALLGLAAAWCTPDAEGALAERLVSGFFRVSEEGLASSPGFWDTLAELIRYPALAFLLGFSVCGYVLLPCLTAARAFGLSFTVAVLTRAMGLRGWLFGLAAYGLGAAVSVPCLLLLSVRGFDCSLGLSRMVFRSRGRASPLYGGAFFRGALGCFAALGAWAAAVSAAMPHILTLFAAG